MRMQLRHTLIGLLLAIVWSASVTAAPTPGNLTRCAELELRVAGLFHIGTAFLYLDECASAPRILDSVPKQFSLDLARDFKGEDLVESARSILTRNLGVDSHEELPEVLRCLADAYVDADSGDRYDVVYRPGEGLGLYLNDRLVQSCDDSEGAEKYFMIWFGEDPFHRRMRDRLLEQAEAAAATS